MRVLRTAGYQVKHVLNITDIGHLTGDNDEGEDKMLQSARQRHASVLQIAELFTTKFFEDAATLNLLPPDIVCRATDHITDMIAFIQGIERAGFTYEAGGNIYFDTGKYPDYGQLRGYGIKDNSAHHRVEVDQHKHHAEDFVLWFTRSKFEDQALHWPSPWGEGYPGWHLECSAMSLRHLGSQLDIHCGGIDHISVHHTNEIAQNYACNHTIGAKYWLHGEFLTMNQEKMSKSGESFLTVDRLQELDYDPLDYRYLCLGTHYRKPLAFHDEAMTSAKQARYKLRLRAQDLATALPSEATYPKLQQHPYWNEFFQKSCTDLNTPEALAVVWNMLKDATLAPGEKAGLLQMMEEILALGLFANATKTVEKLEPQLMEMIQQREEARRNKDYRRADELRNSLLDKGIVIEDTSTGTIWKRKLS